MLFDHGEGYQPEIPEGYTELFNPQERFPKAPQAVFFSPAQPSNAWGEPSVTYHNGRYYLWFCNWGDPTSQSLATSSDGIHWREEGYTFVPDPGYKDMGEAEIFQFDPDGPFVKIYCLGCHICFATSADLIHWKRLGPEHFFNVDERWYSSRRWDSLFILPREEGGWMAVLNAIPKNGRGLGFATSEDGIAWTAQPPVKVEIPWFEDKGYAGELSGFAKFGDKYFISCDAWIGLPFGKTSGVGLQRVFVSDRPEGPYRPTKRNYVIGTAPSIYEKFHRSADGELITESMVWYFSERGGRHYRVPPFKLVESDGENLWYRWWKQNEKLKADEVRLEDAKPVPESGGSLALIDKPFDLDRGLVVEGTVDFSGVKMPEPEADWAQGATFTSSCDRNRPAGAPGDGYPEAAADGNMETAWRHMGESQADEGWLELDFGQVRPVGRIRICWWQRDEASYTVELSEDRKTWHTVAENKADKMQVLHSGQEHEFSPIIFINHLDTEARYLRIRAVGPEVVKHRSSNGENPIDWLGGNKWGIVEINVHEASDWTAGREPDSLPGLYFECEEGHGEAVLFSPEGLARFGSVNTDGTGFQPYLTREIGKKPGDWAIFRIIQRNNLAEIYLDDYHLHIMHLRRPSTGRLGFVTSGGQNVIRDVRAWYDAPLQGQGA